MVVKFLSAYAHIGASWGMCHVSIIIAPVARVARSGFLGAMRPTAGGSGGRRQLGPWRLRMMMTVKQDDDSAAAGESASTDPTEHLKLNRKTAGQPFSYSSFKFLRPVGCTQVMASTSPRHDPLVVGVTFSRMLSPRRGPLVGASTAPRRGSRRAGLDRGAMLTPC